MEENKEKTDDPSDHHGGINTMDKVTECLDALIEEMRESRAYQNYSVSYTHLRAHET